jgi:hypothetical protein
MEATNDDLTNKLLFQTGPDPQAGSPLDADTEKAKLDAAKSAQQTNTPATTDADSKDKDSATIDKSGNGWLDGIF